MAFTLNQLHVFFTNGPQMGLTAAMRTRLAAEGLQDVNNFKDFCEDQIDDAIKNLRTAIPGVAAIPKQCDANGVVVAQGVAAISSVPPCIIPARAVLRLKIASIAYHYYIDTNRTPTPANINYTNVLRGFYTEWEAIVQQRKADKPTVPVLSCNQSPLRWIESFKDCLYRTYGIRNCPVSYVIRDLVMVPPEATQPLLNGVAYSEAGGSVLQEMLNRYSHQHPLFRTDNNTVYSLLDKATRGTIMHLQLNHSSLASYCRFPCWR